MWSGDLLEMSLASFPVEFPQLKMDPGRRSFREAGSPVADLFQHLLVFPECLFLFSRDSGDRGVFQRENVVPRECPGQVTQSAPGIRIALFPAIHDSQQNFSILLGTVSLLRGDFDIPDSPLLNAGKS